MLPYMILVRTLRNVFVSSKQSRKTPFAESSLEVFHRAVPPLNRLASPAPAHETAPAPSLSSRRRQPRLKTDACHAKGHLEAELGAPQRRGMKRSGDGFRKQEVSFEWRQQRDQKKKKTAVWSNFRAGRSLRTYWGWGGEGGGREEETHIETKLVAEA